MKKALVFLVAPRLGVWCVAPNLGRHPQDDEEPAYVAQFRRDGFAVLKDFSPMEERNEMKAAMAKLTAQYWRNASKRTTVFLTDEGQSEAQAKAAAFFESADGVEFFEEPGRDALNKVGHGLHLDAATPFGKYARSDKVAAVLRSLGYRAPVLPQSMYIFKSKNGAGGEVTSHQDASFLQTSPAQTVVGLWLALDDATVDNGCLWARNASHFEPLRRAFVRRWVSSSASSGAHYTELDEEHPVMVFEDAFAAEDAAAVRDDDDGVSPPPPERAWFDARLLGGGSGFDDVDDAAVRTPRRRRFVGRTEVPWEGTSLDAAAVENLGYVPLPVAAGSLVVFPGTLDHLSLPNTSPDRDRHTFQLHAIEGPKAGVSWCASNWLQYADGRPFLDIFTSSEDGRLEDDSRTPKNAAAATAQCGGGRQTAR